METELLQDYCGNLGMGHQMGVGARWGRNVDPNGSGDQIGAGGGTHIWYPIPYLVIPSLSGTPSPIW